MEKLFKNIISMRFKVCPSEVETLLRNHPGVLDCAVVGRQDHIATEIPAAFVVRSPNYFQLASTEIRKFVAGVYFNILFRKLKWDNRI